MPLHNSKFGIAPALPLRPDKQDGHYALTKNLSENTAQNLKHLILTSPGERMMDISFGVGLRNFLFENNNQIVRSNIDSKIRQQVKAYMPFVEVIKVEFNSLFDKSGSSDNGLNLDIRFRIVPLNLFTSLEIEVGTN